MRREKRRNIHFSLLGVIISSTILTACSVQSEDITLSNTHSEDDVISSNIDYQDKIQESESVDKGSIATELEGDTQFNTDLKNETDISDTASDDELQEPIPNEDGSMEIYSAREIISLSDDIIVGQVLLEDILEGNPILYDRVIIDGFVVEWILTDYEDEESILIEEGVLLISKENDTENTQVIRAQGRGGCWGPPAALANKFEYMDVNFDNVPDLLVCTGHHGNQGLITYYCFLQTDTGFVESPTFTEIANPAVDTENKLILSQWRNWAASHSWAEYKYQDNVYVLDRELCEEAEGYDEDGNDIWVWTVNGEVIGKSDELSESEIEDLIYNENSEWRILDDRWRTIYNNGLNADYSIYNEP